MILEPQSSIGARASCPLSRWERARVRGFFRRCRAPLAPLCGRREGATLSCRPSADAVAGNGGALTCAPSADAVAGNAGLLSLARSADAVAGGAVTLTPTLSRRERE